MSAVPIAQAQLHKGVLSHLVRKLSLAGLPTELDVEWLDEHLCGPPPGRAGRRLTMPLSEKVLAGAAVGTLRPFMIDRITLHARQNSQTPRWLPCLYRNESPRP